MGEWIYENIYSMLRNSYAAKMNKPFLYMVQMNLRNIL